jgi:SAM-dependent methyltransferase
VPPLMPRTALVGRAAVRVRTAAREEGVLGVCRVLAYFTRYGTERLWVRIIDVGADIWLGARTRGITSNQQALRRLTSERDGTWYEPIRVDKFLRMMAVTKSAVPLDAATFVDLGAGRGRALLLAGRLSFKQVVGVEIDPALVASAEENADAFARRLRRAGREVPDLRVVAGDVARTELPDGPLVVFIYNAFGHATMTRVVERLSRRSGAVVVAYFNPLHEGPLRSSPILREHRRGKDWVIYASTAA